MNGEKYHVERFLFDSIYGCEWYNPCRMDNYSIIFLDHLLNRGLCHWCVEEMEG